MSLQLVTYQDPSRAAPLDAAYAFVDGISIGVSRNRLQLDVSVYASQADYAAGVSPIRVEHVMFGNDGVPDLATFIGANAASWAGLRTAFYAAITNHPTFSGATAVP